MEGAQPGIPGEVNVKANPKREGQAMGGPPRGWVLSKPTPRFAPFPCGAIAQAVTQPESLSKQQRDLSHSPARAQTTKCLPLPSTASSAITTAQNATEEHTLPQHRPGMPAPLPRTVHT